MSKLWTAMCGHSFEAVRQAVEDIIAEGFPMSALLLQLVDDTVRRASLSDLAKSAICEKAAQADQCLADGASESLQLLDVAAFIMRQVSNNASSVDALVSAH